MHRRIPRSQSPPPYQRPLAQPSCAEIPFWYSRRFARSFGGIRSKSSGFEVQLPCVATGGSVHARTCIHVHMEIYAIAKIRVYSYKCTQVRTCTFFLHTFVHTTPIHTHPHTSTQVQPVQLVKLLRFLAHGRNSQPPASPSRPMEKEVALLSSTAPVSEEDWETWRGELQPPVFALKRECDTFNTDVSCYSPSSMLVMLRCVCTMLPPACVRHFRRCKTAANDTGSIVREGHPECATIHRACDVSTAGTPLQQAPRLLSAGTEISPGGEKGPFRVGGDVNLR